MDAFIMLLKDINLQLQDISLRKQWNGREVYETT